MRLTHALLISAVAGLASGAPADAASTSAVPEGCAPYAEVVEFLARDHAEEPVASGVANNGGLVEVFASREHETWTLLITMPDGHTCMMAAGNEWMEFRESTAPPTAEMPPEPGT